MMKLKRLCQAMLLALGAATFAAQALAADEAPANLVQEKYTKYEFRIPMRDGVKLMTVVYVPKDSSKTYPFLMVRSPYGSGSFAGAENHYGVDFYPSSLGPGKEFQEAGYIFVNQDVRGRYMSEGKWQEATPHQNPDKKPGEGIESQDMYDTVEWLLKNIGGNNGKVGIWGISYPGFYTSASIIDSHPAIKAASPQAPVTNLYKGDDSYHNGAFMLAANFDFYASFTEQKNPTPEPRGWRSFDYGTPDGYRFFLKQLSLGNILAQMSPEQRELLMPTIQHDTYDAFWQSRDISRHLRNISAAVLTVGGLFDAEDVAGPFYTYQAIRANRPANAKAPYNGLVIGPWVHGGWAGAEGKSLGLVQFGSKTSEYYRKNILFPFFEQHLKGVQGKALPEVHAFETGTNVWREYASWPPKQAKQVSLYLQADGKLSWQQPAGGAAFDEYVADPKKPVPFINYPATGAPREYMVSDQRFASQRPDVLSYMTDVLEDDVTVAGPVQPQLFVSTTGTDADFVVKLIDVYPDDYPDAPQRRKRGEDIPVPETAMGGYQQLVRGEPFRGKFRNSFEKPEAFVPREVSKLQFALPDVNHTFRRGHRIMVQIQSSWFPLVDLNPQKFMHIPSAKPEDFVKATQRVYHAPGQYSALVLPVLQRANPTQHQP
jgi:putative CocE/NonD family hydrolase